MASQQTLHRRAFLRSSTAGGFSLGGLLGLGFNLNAARAEVRRLKIKRGREVPSVCPYCAVGCGQIVTARDGQIVNIEGNPESPINRGSLCPKGAATYQLAVNPHRVTRVWYRAPGATEWDKTRSLDWAMDRIARLIKETREATFQKVGRIANPSEQTAQRQNGYAEGVSRLNHTLAIASLGGATMDNEWNYLQCKLMRSLGIVFLENQARI